MNRRRLTVHFCWNADRSVRAVRGGGGDLGDGERAGRLRRRPPALLGPGWGLRAGRETRRLGGAPLDELH